MKKFAAFVLLIAAGMWTVAGAQEFKPTKHENSTWHQVVLVKYKTGKIGEVKKIIEKYKSASEASGAAKPEMYWFLTGPYDAMVVWDLDGGPSDLEWKYSPESIKWWNGLVEQEGSQEAAMKLQQEYDALVASTTSHFLRRDE